MESFIAFAFGIVFGIIIGFVIAYAMKIIQSRTSSELAGELFRESELRRAESEKTTVENLKNIFGNLSFDALQKSTDEFLKIAKERLESERSKDSEELEKKKILIDRQLQTVSEKISEMSGRVDASEKDRISKFSELSGSLTQAKESIDRLSRSTETLSMALSNSRVRGQWGERMAEDVLRLAGMTEKVNYTKQTMVDNGGRPDFTFLMPRGLVLNMDVKFPFDNYLRYLEAGTENERDNFRKIFLRDVRSKISEITTREYIDPGQNTVDYVILFIPNEQVYSFIQEQDSSIIEECLKNKVIMCSPFTLFAILAVIRQAVDNFALEQRSKEILSLLGNFRVQWGRFADSIKKLGDKIDSVQKEYHNIITTRKNQLDRVVMRIEEKRVMEGIEAEPETEPLNEISESEN
jgi:DNA recombination protein RmuC